MEPMVRVRTEELLLGEWACLGILEHGRAHGYDVAMRLGPDGDIGRVWSMSRPMTYRSLDQLEQRGAIKSVSEEPGLAGGNRTILGPTRRGRTMLRRWLVEPAEHLRDVRTELLLKLVLCDLLGVSTGALLAEQRERFTPLAAALRRSTRRRQSIDPVEVWRDESSRAVLRFIDRLSDR